MPSKFPYQLGDEPVPGYRLVKFLGKGNFGEVWQAKAPGGASVAIKLIPDLSTRQAHKEFRALGIIKNLHHPNLVPVNAVWLKDAQGTILDDAMVDSDQLPAEFAMSASESKGTIQIPILSSNPMLCELIIAMGLGHRSLFDRLTECRTSGLPGIPADELLGYMEEAAKAIDYLNTDRVEAGVRRSGVQHCDIKPHNILITGTSAQVCDFGLARVQGAVRATASLSGTVAYAAPECLENAGDASPTTDQYSLAISYYELRTGELPYAEETLTGIMRASLKGELDLSQVPESEQAVLRKATARQPGERYPTAVAMVRALRTVVEGQGSAPPITATSRDSIIAPASKAASASAPIPAGGTVPSPKSSMALPIAAAVLLLAIGGIWWGTRPPSEDEPTDDPKDNPSISASADAPTDDPDVHQQSTFPDTDVAASGENHIEDVAVAKPDPAASLVAMADTMTGNGDYQAAIATYDDAIKVSPNNAAAHFGRGVALASTQKLDDAIGDFEAAKRLDEEDQLHLSSRPEPAEAYLERAKQRRVAGDHAGAAQDCEVVIRDYSDHAAQAHCERGASYRDQENFEKALEDLSKAIELSPQFALAFSRRGYVHLRLRQFKEALADLDKSLEIEPDDIDFLNRAIVYSATGKLTEALTELDRLVARDPENDSAMYQRGLVYRDMANYPGAIRDLRSALSLDPKNGDAKASLGMLLACSPEADDADLDEADRLATEAVESSTQRDAMHLDARAAVLAKRGDFDAARQHAQRAVELAAGTASAANYQARLTLYESMQPYVLPAAP